VSAFAQRSHTRVSPSSVRHDAGSRSGHGANASDGPILIVLPVYIAVLLILKALQGLLAAAKPITAAIPGSVEFEEILAICLP
jgi:hypothetical protein